MLNKLFTVLGTLIILIGATLSQFLLFSVSDSTPAMAQSTIQDILDITWLNSDTIDVKVTDKNKTITGSEWIKMSSIEGQYHLRFGTPCAQFSEFTGPTKCHEKEDGKFTYAQNSNPAKQQCPKHGHADSSKGPGPVNFDVWLNKQTSRILAAEKGASKVDLRLMFWNDSKAECVTLSLNGVTAEQGSAGGTNVIGEWVASNAIRIYSDQRRYFKTEAEPNIFVSEVLSGDNVGECPNGLKIVGENGAGNTLVDWYDHKSDGGDSSPIRPNCKVDSEIKNGIIVGSENKNKEAINPNVDDGTEEQPLEDSCETTWKTPLSWVLCPIANGLSSILGWYYEQITNLLDFNPMYLDSNVLAAWSNVRNIANVLFVIAFLIIIISQLIAGRL